MLFGFRTMKLDTNTKTPFMKQKKRDYLIDRLATLPDKDKKILLNILKR